LGVRRRTFISHERKMEYRMIIDIITFHSQLLSWKSEIVGWLRRWVELKLCPGYGDLELCLLSSVRNLTC